MAKFEDVLPALRAGKKVRRASWPKDWFVKEHGVMVKHNDGQDLVLSVSGLNADDWEVIEEPKRVADYFCPVFGLDLVDPPYYRETHEVGKQPEGAVLVPGSEREVTE